MVDTITWNIGCGKCSSEKRKARDILPSQKKVLLWKLVHILKFGGKLNISVFNGGISGFFQSFLQYFYNMFVNRDTLTSFRICQKLIKTQHDQGVKAPTPQMFQGDTLFVPSTPILFHRHPFCAIDTHFVPNFILLFRFFHFFL